ncbi:hypothetical protein DFS34DRAFT_649148 [Phlyctochytrium arcticum]|nr:hypothetical protein DFS34DRAFT_649148 [Phlyctochytrium arcticum]
MLAVDKELEINGLVREYFKFADYAASLETFETECDKKGRGVNCVLEKEEEDAVILKIQDSFIAAFHDGDRAAFFKCWDEQFPQEVRTAEPSYQKLEFMCSIYFAVVPIHPGVEAKVQSQYTLESTMETFKKFLETGGADLCKTTQFLSYYALPYVPDPRQHPSFKDIFETNWVGELEEKLKVFLQTAIRGNRKPKLLKLLEEGGQSGKQDLEVLQKDFMAVQEREQQQTHKLRGLQTDYHNLITIASELVQTLTACISGEKITPAYLGGICQRLASFKQGAPGKRDDHPQPYDKVQPQNISQTHHRANHAAAAAESKSRHNNLASATPPRVPQAASGPFEQFLDYAAIRRELTPTMEPKMHRTQAYILQALRMHVTKSHSMSERRTIVSTYLANDFLNVTAGKSLLLDLFDHPAPIVRDQTARLTNMVSSDCAGRGYLLQNQGLVPRLVELMRAEEMDSVFRQNVLGTLQKLSLRRNAQSTMNNVLVIPYLQDLLHDLDGLSEYTIQYGTALLMNLCLRTAGKRQCSSDPERTLKLLTALMEHDSLQVKTYVNGTLYSLFGEPKMRDAAKAMGMEDMLQYLRGSSDEQLLRQIDFVTEQLNSEEVPDDSDTVSEDGEEEDFEEEEEDGPEEDEVEDLPPPSASQATGTALLRKYKLPHQVPPPSHRPYDSLPHHPLNRTSNHHASNDMASSASPHDFRRPRTPSRPGTPTVYKSMVSIPQQRPAAVRESTEGRGGMVQSHSIGSVVSATSPPPGKDSKGKEKAGKKGSKSKTDVRVPISQEEQREINLAFSNRPKIARTPLPGASRSHSVTASLNALPDEVLNASRQYLKQSHESVHMGHTYASTGSLKKSVLGAISGRSSSAGLG